MEKRLIFTISLLASILLMPVVISGCTSSKAGKEDLKSGLRRISLQGDASE